MKSDIFTEKHGMKHTLSEVERLGQFCKLSPSDKGKLRLLAEEMLGLTVRLFDNLKYEFFIENEGKRFTLNLAAKVITTQSKREKMLSLSTDGKNKATQGFFGKISGVFESLMLNDGECEPIVMPYYDGIGYSSYFALSAYRDEIPLAAKEVQEEQWDGLEKSIIATLAKDVVIGVRNAKVEMIVEMEF